MTLAKEDLGEVATALQASISAEFVSEWKPRFNVAPTQRHPILQLEDGARWLRPARWGFRRDKGLLINARSETAKHLPAFRDAYAARRCLVPADGFYEWGNTGAKTKGTPPTWFHALEGGLLLIAGLWQPPPAVGELPFFTVLTTTPNDVVSRIHDRMPVIVAPVDVEEWLTTGNPRLCRPAPLDTLAARVTSTRVNSVKYDDADCLAPAPTPLALNL